MPIYEYVCRPCGSTFEEIRRVAECDVPVPCPGCAAPTATQTPPSFFVRGSAGSRSPRSLAEQLAGKGAMKPAGDGSTGILGHKCHGGCGC
ncbi:MAG TPA: zinc ribbon domain-containing protein [Fibrobacteria bacterium]|nr:zinc ribbon domain-containing protein [Fibrobacteria bacterium]